MPHRLIPAVDEVVAFVAECQGDRLPSRNKEQRFEELDKALWVAAVEHGLEAHLPAKQRDKRQHLGKSNLPGRWVGDFSRFELQRWLTEMRYFRALAESRVETAVETPAAQTPAGAASGPPPTGDGGVETPVAGEAPAVEPAVQATGVTARVATAAAGHSPLASKELAAKLGPSVSHDAVDSFLRRYRAKYPDCFITVDDDDRRRNQPKYLYHTADVWPVLKAHFRA
jgi:hypothetical protein